MKVFSRESKGVSLRITTKLLLLNLAILIVFGILTGVMVLSFGNIEEILSDLTDQNVSRIVSNARCAQSLSRISSGTGLLISTFYRNPAVFEKEFPVLCKEADKLISAYGTTEFSGPLRQLRDSLVPLFQECTRINEIAGFISRIHEKMLVYINEMDQIVSEKMIACILEDQEAADMDQIGILLLSYRETLYRLNLEFSRINPLLSGTDESERIVAILENLERRVRTLLASGPDISAYGQHLRDGVGEYREAVVRLNAHIIEFRDLHTRFLAARDNAEKTVLNTDVYVIRSAEEMKNRTAWVIRSSLYFVFSLSGAAVIFLAVFTYLILLRNIRRPMETVCRGITAIGEGKLDTRICMQRQDEWSVIEQAINKMAADISHSHTSLCEKNRELEKMQGELEMSLERSRKESAQREEAEAERAQLQHQLIHAQKMEALGTLAGGIAHDFNNLLQGIQGYAELMLMGISPDHPHYGKLKEIVRSTRKGGLSVSRLRTFASQEKGNLIRMNLNAKIRDIKIILERSFPKSVQIQLNLDENLHIMEADPFQMDQVLVNLGVNARDAMPEGGTLFFETRNLSADEVRDPKICGCGKGRFVMIRVRDTGCGMDRETLEHIFDPFYTTKEFGRGSGLGLPTVFGIVRQYRGRITCDSEPGKGTCFTICLPALEEN